MRTDEVIPGTSRGTVKARTMRRLRPELQWNAGEVGKVRGTPERPVPGVPGDHIPPQVNDPGKTEREDHYEVHETDHQEDKFEGLTNEVNYQVHETDRRVEKLEGLNNEARDVREL